MRRTSLPSIAAMVLCGALGTDAHATSGWDHHQVDIEGTYRIHGEGGFSAVHRLDGAGSPIEPPLCTNQDHPNFHGPPQYAVTSTHLVVRYANPEAPGAATARCCYAIRKLDSRVAGPLSLDDLQKSQAIDSTALRWKTPATPSAWPLVLVILMGTALGSALFLGLLALGLLAMYAICAYLIRWQVRRGREADSAKT